MSERSEALAARIVATCGEGRVQRRLMRAHDVAFDVAADDLLAVLTQLRDSPELSFEVMMDASGIDYLDYGKDEWRTTSASYRGFSRGVFRLQHDPAGHQVVEGPPQGRRFAMSYQLLSIRHNERVSLRCYCADNDEPALPSVTGVHAGANWFEREAFDLFGILFHGHPDLRRLLTDYGFIGHPFRKDFPLSGHVEVRYDETRQRVVYEPVEITPRTLVPRVIREDNRYAPELRDPRPPAITGSVGNAGGAPRGDGTIPGSRP
jgi:NADH-quinone oxidoreductase subunit C